MYDIIIVGAGAAGLTAGMYAARRELKTLIISPDLGGQTARTDWIENYPGINKVVHGVDLMNEFLAQAQKFGAEFLIREVNKIEKSSDETFTVHTTHEQYQSLAVILAFGLSPRKLGVPGEEEFKNKGVSYCVTCDGPLYKTKVTGVVGNTTHALDAVEFLSKISPEVFWFTNGKEVVGDKALITHVSEISSVKRIDHEVKEIKGDKVITSVVTSEGEVPISGLFIELGYRANTSWVSELVTLDQKRQIIVDQKNQTSCPGVFAAGDITNIDYKQVVISAGEGAKAALEAYKYVSAKQMGKEISVIRPDWGDDLIKK